MPLGIKGKFYANIPILYPIGTFYAVNLAHIPLCAANVMCAHKGKILRQLNFQDIISRVLPPPLM